MPTDSQGYVMFLRAAQDFLHWKEAFVSLMHQVDSTRITKDAAAARFRDVLGADLEESDLHGIACRIVDLCMDPPQTIS